MVRPRRKRKPEARLVESVAAEKAAVIGTNYGPIDMGGRPAPLFIGLPPPPPRALVGRDADLAALRARVCSGEATALTALNGLPGVGKTALATALVYDPAVRERFRGGVLWVGLGTTPNLESALGRWAAALDVDLAGEKDAGARVQRLSAVLQQRARGEPVLLVIDDAWSWEDARPFREIVFPGCTHLMTTRDAGIARQFASEATWVAELTEAEAEAFLAERCPKAREADPEGLRELAKAVGGLPLGLTLIAATLTDRAGQAQWVREEIARLKATEARLGLETAEARPGLEGVSNSVRAILEMSLEALDEETRGAFAALGAFAPKPAEFGREAVLAVWGVDAAAGDERLRRLTDRGLLEVAGEGRFALHQVLVDVARGRLGDDTGSRERHARFHVELIERDEENWRKIEREMGQIREGWAWATCVAHGGPLVLRYARSLEYFFDRRGLLTERLAWTNRALQAATALERRNEEACWLLHLGIAYRRAGDPERAEVYVEQALAASREAADLHWEGNALNTMGQILAKRGEVARAGEYYEQARQICVKAANKVGEAAILHNIGRLAQADGRWQEALVRFQDALVVFRETHNREFEANALVSIGRCHANSGEHTQARHCLEGALVIRRELGDLVGEARELSSLAELCLKMGDAKTAVLCHEDALPIWQRLSNRHNEKLTLWNLCYIYASTKQHVHELRCRERLLVVERELGHRRCEARIMLRLGALRTRMGQFAAGAAIIEAALVIPEASDLPVVKRYRTIERVVTLGAYVFLALSLLVLTLFLYRRFHP